MLKGKGLNNTAILIDFDGTITVKDTNISLMKKYSNDKIEQLDREFNERSMTLIEFMDRLFSVLDLREEEYLDFILNEMELSEGFVEFYKKAKEYNIPLIVISGGFSNGIIPFLEKYGVNDMEVYANRLNFNENDITVDFYHDREPECCHLGYCGNCKIKHVNSFKEKYEKIIFIGDGITDIPIANEADKVFAKATLLDYCKEHNIHCIPWDDFFDIKEIVFKPTN